MDERLLTGKRALAVEDEMLVMMMVEGMLGDLGCNSITVAESVDTALGFIASTTFDLAILDVNLNGTKSFPIADALKTKHVPFAFATGYGAKSIDERFKDRPVLNKPYNIAQFEGVIATLLAETRMREQLA